MKRCIAILLTVVTCCIGYELVVRHTNESRPLQGQPSPASRHESANIVHDSSSASGSAPKVATPPPARPQGPKAGTLEEGFTTPWTRIQVALSGDDGCTGLRPAQELFISRKDNGMTISGRECVAYGKFENIPERPLAKDEFDEIERKLNDFYQIAKSEIDLQEHFCSLQPADQKKQLEAYYREHGVPYGGFGGIYFYVQFYSDKPDMIVKNAFEDSKSVETYVDWMRVWWKSCRDTLDP